MFSFGSLVNRWYCRYLLKYNEFKMVQNSDTVAINRPFRFGLVWFCGSFVGLVYVCTALMLAKLILQVVELVWHLSSLI
jgi:hypothetical protein